MFNLARSTSRVCNIADRKLFFTSLRLLKNLSADSTVAGIVKNILKIIQTFGNNSHTSHTGYKGGDHCFKVLWKYCKWLVSPVWFRNLRISGYVLLILNSHLIRPCISLCGASLTISKMHSTPSRCTISTCVLHCSYLLILNFSVIILHICATFEGYCC